VDNIIVIVLGTFLVSFAIAYVSVLQKLSKITQEFAKLYISHQSLQDFV
jgi:archaellum component FlaF (FlaF/FlaG flagellin family)